MTRDDGRPALPERLVRWFDDRQQDRPWLALPVGVVRKYADDRGTAYSGLVTFHVFVGLLPLLVVVLTVLSRVLEGSEDLREAALDSTLGQMPVLGPRIREDLSALEASGLGLTVAAAGLLWTSAGIYHSLQLAMNQVWNVPGIHRQGFVSRHVRALALFAFLLLAAMASTPLRGWHPGPLPAPVVLALSWVVGSLLTSAVLVVVLRLVVSPDIPLVRIAPAALVAGVLWEALQRFGALLVADRLERADDLYGSLGLVVVTLFWINLLARATVLANEAAVVVWRRLWPRRIAQPPLTDADRAVLAALARNERRRPEQHVDVRFDGAGDGCDAGDRDGEATSQAEEAEGADERGRA